MTAQKKKRKAPGKASSPVGPGASTPAADGAEESAPADASDEHPLRVGSSVVVRYRDGSARLASIVEASGRNGEFKYYIHYVDFNRRMDEWMEPDRILKFPSELPSDATSVHAEESSDVSPSRPTTVREQEHDEHEGMDAAALVEHEQVTRVKNIRAVALGRHIMECWYFSPYPEEIWSAGPVDLLYLCEFSFRFFRFRSELVRHLQRPQLPRHPPGNEIYRDDNVSMFEVDGASERLYCQNLCYFAKLFLDHKTLYWDVEPFLFYVLCTFDARGYHPVGFFSKEKHSDLGFNLACILAFPFAQRKSYGKFLIRFSYELSKKEKKLGSPEKPLSDLGAVSYKSYWSHVLLCALKEVRGDSVSIAELSYATSMLAEDIVPTLRSLRVLVERDDGEAALHLPPQLLDSLLAQFEPRGLSFDASCLQWIPLYVVDASIDRWSIQYHRSRGVAAQGGQGHGKGKGSLTRLLGSFPPKKELPKGSRNSKQVAGDEAEAMDVDEPGDSTSCSSGRND